MAIRDLIANIPQKSDGALPVVFFGHSPRLIGYAQSTTDADWLAIMNRLSCNYVSRCPGVTLDSGEKSPPFFILHS